MANNRVTFNIEGILGLDVSNMTKELQTAQQALRKLQLPSGMDSRFENLFTKLNEQISEFQNKSKRTFTDMSDVKAANKAYDNMANTLKELSHALNNIDTSKISLNKDFVKNLEQGKAVLQDFDNQAEAAGAEIAKLHKTLSKKMRGYLNVDELTQAAAEGKNLGSQLAVLKRQNTRLKVDRKEINAAKKEVDVLKGQLDEANAQLRAAKKEEGRSTKDTAEGSVSKTMQEMTADTTAVRAATEAVHDYKKEIKSAEQRVAELQQRSDDYKSNIKIIEEIESTYKQLSETTQNIDLSKIFEEIPAEASNTIVSLEEFKQILTSLSASQPEQVAAALEEINTILNQGTPIITTWGDDLNRATDQANNIQSMENQIKSLQNSMLHFFSLTNGWRLLRQAIKNAFTTVKELDDAMTEIAVVSDYTLDQVWEMRSEYSRAATDMGAKTIDLVNATKLYVQQGLNLAEAQEVGVETIKMARIANLDGAQATDLMTAAIRGFRMELLEANKVNDIYSELAAKTAADTREIAIAMSKTASIASNAGAEFGNMSAFLSQIIETTREAPETAGTAMKTIIARFQELKKPMDEIGEVDGEIVDANAIETALRTAGVALRDFKGEFRDFDDVIIELSSKWDTLDLMTQRYIATTAAGARQQSRFIALVQDNARLTELLAYASNSAGASAEQFNKTLDSLQAKLNEMNNAIAIFWTNLTNSTVIKGAIDLITMLFNAINAAVGVFSELPGILGDVGGMVATIALAFAGFKLAKAIIQIFFSGLGKMFFKGGVDAGTTYSSGVATGIKGGLEKVKKQISTIFSKNFWAGEVKLKPADFGPAIKAQENLANAQKAYIASMDPATTAAFTQAQTTLRTSLLQTGAAYGLVEAQQSTYNALVMAGVPVETAAAAAKGGLTTEQLANNAEVLKSLGLTNAEIAAKRQETIATYAAAGAEQFENEQTQIGLLARIKNVAVLLFGSQAKREAAAATLGLAVAEAHEAVATGTATAAQWLLNAAIYACPIGWILLGIGALIGLFVGLAAIIETDAEKVTKLNETMDAMAQEAEDARSALEDIANQKDKLNELTDTFNDATHGTQAWKEALVAVNQQVLELISKYPTLAKHLKNTQGQLSIDEQGWDELVQQQQTRLQTALVTQTGASQRKRSIEDRVDATQTRREASTTGWDTAGRVAVGVYTAGLSELRNWLVGLISGTTSFDLQEDMTNLLKTGIDNIEYTELTTAFGEAGLQLGLSSKEEFKRVFDLSGVQGNFDAFYDEINRDTEAFNELSIQLAASAIAAEAERDAMIATTMAQEEFVNNDYSAQMTGALDRMFDDMGQRIDEAKDNLDVGKGTSDDLKSQYAELMGITVDEVNAKLEDKSLSENTMRDALATAKVEGEMADQARETAKTFANLSDTLRKSGKVTEDALQGLVDSFKGLATEDVKDLTTLDMENIASAFEIDQSRLAVDQAYIEQEDGLFTLDPELIAQVTEKLNAMGIDLEQLNNMGFESVDAYVKHLVSGQDKIDKAFANLTSRGFNTSELKTLNLSSIEELGRQATTAFQHGGEAGLTELNNLLSDALAGITDPKQKQKFIDAFNSIDLTDASSIKKFSAIAQQLGVNIPLNQLDDFKKKLLDLGLTINSLDFTGLKNQIIANNQLIKDIQGQSGESFGRFDEETMQQLIDSGTAEASDFKFNGEDFTYVGGTMESLTVALQNNTTALTADTIASREAMASIGEKIGAEGFIDTYDQKTVQMVTTDSYGEQDQARLAGFAQTIWDQASTEAEKQVLKDAGFGDGDMSKMTVGDLANAITQAMQLKDSAEANANMANKMREDLATPSPIAKNYKQAAEGGLDMQELDEYIAKLMALPDISHEMATAMATDIMLMNKAITDLGDNWDDWKTILQSAKLDKSLMNTQEFNKVANILRGSLKNLSGTTHDVSDAFLTNSKNMALMEAAAKGDLKAIVALRKEIVKDMTLNIGIKPEAQTEVQSTIDKIMDSVEYENLEIGMTLDDSGFTSMLQSLLDTGAVTVEQMNKILEGIGYEPEIDYMPLDVSGDNVQRIVSAGGFTKVNPDGSTSWVPIKNETEVRSAAASGIQIPVINGKSTKAVKPPKVSTNAARKNTGVGKGGGGGKAEEPWEPDYDWLYNLLEKTNEAIRQRNKLETEYDRILKRRKTTAKALYDNLQEQIKLLKEQQKYFDQQMSGRLKEQADIEKEYSDVRKYAHYNEEAGYVEIDWDAINKLSGAKGNNKKGERIDEYIKKLEELAGKIDSIEDSQYEIIGQLEALYELGYQEYLEFEDRVYNAMIQAEQDQIDALSNINDSINNANSKTLDKLQQSIDETRRIRDNQETEDEIGKMERRMAYLQQDTSGGNQLEILKLQEQIDAARQDYTDSLIDQKINELQLQNDFAAEQREQQIEIMQAQLDHAAEQGLFWAQTHALISEGISAQGDLIQTSQLADLLKSQEGFAGLSALGKMDWLEKLQDLVAQSVTYLSMNRQLESIGKTSGQITFTTADGKTLTGTVDAKGSVTANGATYKDVYQMYDGTYRTMEKSRTPVATTPTTPATPTLIAPEEVYTVKSGDNLTKIANAYNRKGYNTSVDKIAKDNAIKNKNLIITGQKLKIKKYESGGLASATGLAWLDGTKGKPELVLNATDTKNFIELKDTLQGLKASGGSNSSFGDNYFDIRISVAEIGSDYDVERLADTLRGKILEDAQYRNVNAVRIMK